MSLTITRTITHEIAFIQFCQDVARDYLKKSPFWMKNLNQFDRIFIKYREHNKSHVPILTFIESHRDILQQPVVLNSDPNDKWLLFPEDTPEPETKSWMAVQPRGVYLEMKTGEWSHCIPLAEVYAVCLDMTSSSDLTSFKGVSADTVPAKFLYLFYQMLLEAEPDNIFFKENAEACEDMITPYSDMSSNPLSALMSSEGAKQLQGMLSGVANAFDETSQSEMTASFTQFTQTGDTSKLLSSFAPLLQNPAIQGMMAGMAPMMAGFAPPAGEESGESTDPGESPTVEEMPVEDQD